MSGLDGFLERCPKHDVPLSEDSCPVCFSIAESKDGSWIAEWQKGAHDQELFDELRLWGLTLNDAARQLSYRFPPNCLVKPKPGKDLLVPQDGTTGIAVGVRERQKADGGYELTVMVTQSPNSGLRAECDPDDLEVVGFWKDLTGDKIRALVAQ
jgi:hypothetical protein